MIYETRDTIRYSFKQTYPMVVFAMVLMFMFGLIYSPYLSAGDTMFKECKHCGHLNYQFSNTCSMCGTTGRFEDVYLKPDCEKRDAKKHKAKELVQPPVTPNCPEPKPTCNTPRPFKISKKNLYNEFIKPINKVAAKIIHYRDWIKAKHSDLIWEISQESRYFEKLDSAFDNLLRAREQLIEFHGLEEYRQSRKADELIYSR